MKRLFIITFILASLVLPTQAKVVSNEKIDNNKVKVAAKIIKELQAEMSSYTDNGSGPFVAAIYDDKGNLVVKVANSVVNETCSNNHAEVNAIKLAEQKLGTYDLAKENLSLYVTAEPCMMCLGAIMWSGIKNVYYGVPSKRVEEITGFDEGFKPDWFNEFKKRGITVYGNIEVKAGEKELHKYVKSNKTIYKPER